MSAAEPVGVRILDREYTVGCEPGEKDGLMAAAKLLDAKMREIRGGNRVAALDRVAVLAALNLAHELQQLREDSERRDRSLAAAVDDLQRKVEGLLDAPR